MHTTQNLNVALLQHCKVWGYFMRMSSPLLFVFSTFSSIKSQQLHMQRVLVFLLVFPNFLTDQTLTSARLRKLFVGFSNFSANDDPATARKKK